MRLERLERLERLKRLDSGGRSKGSLPQVKVEEESAFSGQAVEHGARGAAGAGVTEQNDGPDAARTANPALIGVPVRERSWSGPYAHPGVGNCGKGGRGWSKGVAGGCCMAEARMG